jgi:tetratricopeptide (TPR) repeat protein
MLARCALLALLLSTPLLSQDTPPDPIPPLLKEGDAAYLKGDYPAAFDAFSKGWEAAQQTPNDNPVRYDILKRIAGVRAAAGEFADADSWLQQAITWRENILGPKDPKIADDLLLSVGYCRALKDFERAMIIMRKVRLMHMTLYGVETAAVADDMTRMAQIYMEQKKPEEAISLHLSAIAIRTRMGGPLDPTLVPDLDRLGELYTVMRDYPSAEGAFRHDLVIRETIYGKVHADLISTVDGLAYAMFGEKKYDEAEVVYKRLLDLWIASVGKEHPMIAVTLDKIAVFYAAQKKLPEVREALERSTAIRAYFHAMGLSQQATQAFSEQHQAEAKALYERALVILGEPNPVTEEMRKQFEGIVKALEEQTPKSPAPARRSTGPSTPKKL